ncbi:FecR family protein [Hymenobacter coccineus]|uniref:FecR family protein n=1 Tax=Hymenobacter coccineus TaxID=1908235 RepID=UPI000F77C82C|nr:FecR domain-containing protein [Hymenobacter coccineus]
MTEVEFHLLLQRYLNGHSSPKERAMVERWYTQLGAAKLVAQPLPDQEAVEGAIWQRLQQAGVGSGPKIRTMPPPAAFWRRPKLRWAAAALATLGLGALLPYATHRAAPPLQVGVTTEQGWTRRTNATRQVQVFQLPDSSLVTLHPGSSLRYATAFLGPKRAIYLEGEAFFKVSKNPARPFLVFTKQVVTTVLGTSFRVKAYAGSNEASVAVREGKVAVQARKDADLEATPAHPAVTGVLLLPNQQVVYSATSRHLKKELVDKPVVLVPQAFEFEERPVTEVLAALEKAYGVHMVYDKAKLAGCTVSITFYNEPLFEKLGLLCKSLGAYYQLSDAEIIIHSTGCQSKTAN